MSEHFTIDRQFNGTTSPRRSAWDRLRAWLQERPATVAVVHGGRRGRKLEEQNDVLVQHERLQRAAWLEFQDEVQAELAAGRIVTDPVVPGMPELRHVGIDFGNGASIQSFMCSCGWETSSCDALVEHMKGHGVTRVVVSPIRRRL